MTDLAHTSDWNSLRVNLHPATRFDWATRPAMSIRLAHEEGASEDGIQLDWQAEGALFTVPAC